MASNENTSLKSLNELLFMFMRQAAVEKKSRRAPQNASREAFANGPRSGRERSSKQ